MATAMTSGFSRLVQPGLRKVYFSTLADIPKEFRQLFNVINDIPRSQAGGPAGGNYFDDVPVSSLGAMGLKPEGQNISYDSPVQGSTVRYTPYTYGLGFRITEEMQEDDLYGVMAKMTRELSISAAHQLEVQAFRILNGGFGTTSGTGFTAAGADSLALFSTAHTLLNGGSVGIIDPETGSATTTRRNRSATDLDLSVTALELAMDTFEGWVNHSGMPTPKRGSVLVYPYTQKWLVKELLDSELKPWTGDNEVNPIASEGIVGMPVHYLTDLDSWFLLSPKMQHDLNVWVRRAPKFEVGDDFDSGDAKAKATLRIATGHTEPDGAFGSQGA